jgi:hypothetical protein
VPNLNISETTILGTTITATATAGEVPTWSLKCLDATGMLVSTQDPSSTAGTNPYTATWTDIPTDGISIYVVHAFTNEKQGGQDQAVPFPEQRSGVPASGKA